MIIQGLRGSNIKMKDIPSFLTFLFCIILSKNFLSLWNLISSNKAFRPFVPDGSSKLLSIWPIQIDNKIIYLAKYLDFDNDISEMNVQKINRSASKVNIFTVKYIYYLFWGLIQIRNWSIYLFSLFLGINLHFSIYGFLLRGRPKIT